VRMDVEMSEHGIPYHVLCIMYEVLIPDTVYVIPLK
jgi:hypothetical protein